jgi:hypothetical protein
MPTQSEGSRTEREVCYPLMRPIAWQKDVNARIRRFLLVGRVRSPLPYRRSRAHINAKRGTPFSSPPLMRHEWFGEAAAGVWCAWFLLVGFRRLLTYVRMSLREGFLRICTILLSSPLSTRRRGSPEGLLKTRWQFAVASPHARTSL